MEPMVATMQVPSIPACTMYMRILIRLVGGNTVECIMMG